MIPEGTDAYAEMPLSPPNGSDVDATSTDDIYMYPQPAHEVHVEQPTPVPE